MKQLPWRWLAIGFLLFILAVIVAADMDAIPIAVRDIYRFPGGDKLGHFVLYGILAYLLARAFPRSVHRGWFSVPIVILVLIAFTVLEELSQSLFAQRTASATDLAASLSGILLATWLAGRRK
jgi:polysaccharide biosynthesis protein VpsQ